MTIEEHRKMKNRLQKEWRAKNPDKIRRYEKTYADKHPEKVSDKWHRKNLRTYGLTTDQYNELFLKQNGLCSICQRDRGSKRLAVDHNHKTNKVRGLLCQFCNTALGKFLDDVEILKRAISYLEKSQQEE